MILTFCSFYLHLISSEIDVLITGLVFFPRSKKDIQDSRKLCFFSKPHCLASLNYKESILMSKKIVFVEKEEGSYDPVMAFFNKKQPSAPKTLNSSKPASVSKTTSAVRPSDKHNLASKTVMEKASREGKKA